MVTGDGRALQDDFQRKELERGEAARVQLEKIEQNPNPSPSPNPPPYPYPHPYPYPYPYP